MEPASPKRRVLVTGASGYIGLHCVAELLRAGYRVRGTTRDLSREAAVRAALPDGLGSSEGLEFVALEMLSDRGWAEAMAGCEFVFHLASPLPLIAPNDEMLTIGPAVQGAQRALTAAAQAGVRRVVLISSLAAVHINHPKHRKRPFDESDWSIVDDGLDTYSKSKTLAERAAWACLEQLGERAPELVVLNPGYVFGPALPGTYSTSLEWIRKPLAREVPGYVELCITFTDVRDLARLFVRALEAEGAAGHRFCVTGHIVGYGELIARLVALFGPRGFRVSTRRVPTFAARLIGLFDPAVKLALQIAAQPVEIDTTRLQTVFGFEPTPIDDTLQATVESLIEAGRIRAADGA